MDLETDTNNVYCRLCLANLDYLHAEEELVNISKDARLYERIREIFQFNPITTDDNGINFSPFLCLECHTRVNDIADFIETVQKNQVSLENGFRTTITEMEGVFCVKDEAEIMEIEYLDDRAFEVNSLKEENEEDKVEIFECKLCARIFLSQVDLSQHVRDSHSRYQRNQSIQSHSISKYLFCEICERQITFDSFKDMLDHYEAKHGTRGYVRCCNKQFFTRKSIVNHSSVHNNPADYMCKICQKLLPDKYTLRDHVQRHKPEEEKRYECDFCHKKFHITKDLADHINRLHRIKDKQEEREMCLECNKSFVSKYSLMTHNRRFHMDIERPICETCGKECRSKADLTTHIKARHTDAPKSKCDICGNMVKYLQKHKQIHIESELQIKCDICGLKTTTFKYLRLHMKIHTDEKPYECSTCGTAFKRKNALEDHMSTHSGIPRHFCNYCNRTFNNSGNKSKHIKNVHAQEVAEMSKRVQNDNV